MPAPSYADLHEIRRRKRQHGHSRCVPSMILRVCLKECVMVSHRRPGMLDRLGLRWLTQTAPIPAQRQPGVELVDARSRLAHRVSEEAILKVRVDGGCRALCGTQILVASMCDPGR